MKTQTKEYRETQLCCLFGEWGKNYRDYDIEKFAHDLSDAEFDKYIEMLDTSNKITKDYISNKILSYKDYVIEFERWENNAIHRLEEGYYNGMSCRGIEKEIQRMKNETNQADKRTYNGRMTRTFNNARIQIAEMIIDFIRYSCLMGCDEDGKNIYKSPLGYIFKTTGTT